VTSVNLDINFDVDDIDAGDFDDEVAKPLKPSFLAEWWQSIDRMALGLFLALLAIGVIVSMSTSPVAAARIERGQPFFFLMRHMVFVFMGLGGALFISALSPQNARRIGILALIGGIIALCLVFTHGFTVKGATRWLRMRSPCGRKTYRFFGLWDYPFTPRTATGYGPILSSDGMFCGSVLLCRFAAGLDVVFLCLYLDWRFRCLFHCVAFQGPHTAIWQFE